jgi:thymidylate kinase
MAKIITLDGHDYTGKSSLIELCKEKLIENGNTAISLRSMTEQLDNYRRANRHVQHNPWFYLSAWIQTESKIRESSAEYILVDRSYYSTYVLCKTLGIKFPDFLLKTLIKPDLAVQVKVDEKIRLERMRKNRDLNEIDKRTKDGELIRRADAVYESLGLCPIFNNGQIENTAEELYDKVSKPNY